MKTIKTVKKTAKTKKPAPKKSIDASYNRVKMFEGKQYPGIMGLNKLEELTGCKREN